MSRVEDHDDRAAVRAAENRRLEEAKANRKAQENNAFQKLVGQQKTEAKAQEQAGLAKSAIAHLLEKEGAEEGTQRSKQERNAGEAKHTAAGQAKESAAGKEQVAREGRAEGDAAIMERTEGEHVAAGEASQGEASRSESGRKSEASSWRSKLDESHRSEEQQGARSSNAGAAGGARGEKGSLKADADQSGGQQGQQGGNKDGAQQANPSFRFNPALMAPMSVAKQKEASGSERLRKVANELAQKIVDRVRVGTNAAGKMEFQVDLKGDVLAGLSLKISAKNGKITAVFQGSDKDVLKMIEEQSDTLRQALGSRGLTLEDLKIEAK